MARPKIKNIIPISDADGIAESQTPAAGGEQSLSLAGALTVDGKFATETPHKIIITSAGDDTGRTFTVTGKGIGGQPQTVAYSGANAAATESTEYWREVSSIIVDDNTASSVTVGTNGESSSPWIPVNYRSRDFGLAIGVDLSEGASLTYSIEHTFEPIGNISGNPAIQTHESLVNLTASADGNYEYPPTAVRMVVSTFTSGQAAFTIINKG